MREDSIVQPLPCHELRPIVGNYHKDTTGNHLRDLAEHEDFFVLDGLLVVFVLTIIWLRATQALVVIVSCGCEEQDGLII